MTTIAVDFDGVIHAYSKGWSDGTIYDDPVPGSIASLEALTRAGFSVFIHTTRNAELVAGWLRKRGLSAMSDDELAANGESVGKFWNNTDKILVTDRKLPAIAYIDDRAIRFQSWDQAFDDLKKYEEVVIL